MMSKELEALERILNYWVVFDEEKDDCKQIKDILPKSSQIVETALKEKETQDGVLKILKEIIEFGQVLPHIETNKDNGFDIMYAVGINIQRNIENKERELLRQWILETCFPKELKALEIIKEIDKNALLQFISVCVKDQEEYDLLKEVLL